MASPKKFLTENESDCSIDAQMKRGIQADLQSRYTSPEILKILDVYSFLDPRFKRLDATSDITRSVEGEMLSSLQETPLPS